MDIYDIVKKYLINNSFTALFTDNNGCEESCGCTIDDFMHCDGDIYIKNCTAGYANDCTSCKMRESCNFGLNREYDICCTDKKCWKGCKD